MSEQIGPHYRRLVPRCFAPPDNLDAVILLTTCNLLTTDQKPSEGHDQVLITPHFIAVFRKLPPAKTGEREEAAAVVLEKVPSEGS